MFASLIALRRRRSFALVALFACALAHVCLPRAHAAAPATPAVALAPILRVDADARPDESESLTPLLQAGLSDDPRWRMVERARLDVLQAESAFGDGGLADAATALREFRPLGASLILICRPELGDLSKPFASCEVIDAITSEPLAAVRAELTDRPFARWYRNPPPADVEAITAAFRAALAEALALRAAEADKRLLTPLFFTGPTELSARLESALAAELATAPAWRMRRALRLDGSRTEALLAATGFSPDGAAHPAAVGYYVWGRFEPAETPDAPDAPIKLRYQIWNGLDAPEDHVASGNAPALAAEILRAFKKIPAPDATGSTASTPTPDAEATRLRIARQMIEEALTLARSTGVKPERFFSRLPADMVHEPLRAQVMHLLAAAAFLAPTDADVQELWLRTALTREAAFSVTWSETVPPYVDQPLNAEARRLQRELIAFADAFWRRPDGSLDLRLLEITFRFDPTRLQFPAAHARLRHLAGIIGEPAVEEIAPHLRLLSLWWDALQDTCPEHRDIEKKMRSQTFRQTGLIEFDPPPIETVETMETLWPLLRLVRRYTGHYPDPRRDFYPPGSPRAKELLADSFRAPARSQPQPRLVATREPSLFELPPPPPPPKLMPLAQPDKAPDLHPDVARRAREHQAFFESIQGKSEAEKSKLRTAFLQKQIAELTPSRREEPPLVPAAPAKPTPPPLDPATIPGLTPEQRIERLREACARPDQLPLILALLAAGTDPLGEPSDQRPPLLVAINVGQEAYAQALLDARPDLTRPWPESGTHGPAAVYLAHAALKRNLPAVAKRIIDLHPGLMKGIHVREDDSLFSVALKHGDPALVGRLVQLGARMGYVVDDVLIDLAQRCARPGEAATGHRLPFDYVRDMVRLVRDLHPDAINVVDDEGRSPLLAAVTRKNHDLVAELIAAGASVQRGFRMGKSIPDLAAKDPVMQRLLLGQTLAQARSAPAAGSEPDGAEVMAQIAKRGAAALADLQLTPRLLSYQDAKKWTLLHHALDLKDEAQSLRLIAAGAPLEAASIRGETPLFFAVFRQMPRAVEALLARGADPSGRGDTVAMSPLLAASIKEDLALMRRLIAAGADVDQTVYDERQPLVVAAIWNEQNLDVIRLLVEAGARLDRADRLGYGPLEYAILKNRVDVLEYLRGKKAPWSRPLDNPEHTPLRLAARYKSRDAVLLLLRQGERDPGALAYATDPGIRALLSDAMQQDAGGQAFSDEELWPAICADTARWKERADAHLAAGGDVNHGSLEWTPLVLAVSSGNVELVRYLLAKGADPKIHPLRNRNKPYYDLSDVGTLRFAWNRREASSLRSDKKAAFAEIIELIVPLEPVDDNQWLFLTLLQERHWIAAEAFLRAGVKPTAYMRERIVTEGRLKGADLERALALLADKS
ncbi:MAG: ankyrin repeat domain-containing protein [Burkholderiales bacterium]|nr:ankyrin repeat domain-containing protein [Opitutaceae bacterium]